MRPKSTQSEQEHTRLFRARSALHQELTRSQAASSTATPSSAGLVCRSRPTRAAPDKCGDIEPDPRFLPKDGDPYPDRASMPVVLRALRGWFVPYLRSRLLPGRSASFPIVTYLFTESNANPLRAVTAGPSTTA